MRDSIRKQVLENELHWLKSINCNVVVTEDGITVSNMSNRSTDFNFYIPTKRIDYTTCNRISDRTDDYLSFQASMLCKGMILENVSDINLILPLSRRQNKIMASEYEAYEEDYTSWERGGSRQVDVYTKFYYISFKNNIIGKMSTVENHNVIGIYDFEIDDQYRNKNHASRFLSVFTNVDDTLYFIQTWSTNLKAVKSYLSAGFQIFENLYRYKAS